MAELSQRKIIFLSIIIGIIVLISFGLLVMSNQSKKTSVNGQLNIWINEGTTEDFDKIKNGFYEAYPNARNINIQIQKQASTTVSGYNSLLLRAIADGVGPDIFMIPKGEFTPLESQIYKIPSDQINITDFSNRFDPIFSDLIVSEKGENEKPTEKLLGVPLGYETLGVFYNRTLFRSGTPSHWSQIESLYGQFPHGIFPTNLGLKKVFVPNISDILPLFLSESDVFSYKTLGSISTPFYTYYQFGDLINTSSEDSTENAYLQNATLRHTESIMREKKANTLDEFMRGNIGMIIGYPSLISELELSQKRIGAKDMGNLIYSHKIPQFSQKNPVNIAKYNFFAISKNSQNIDIAVAFLEYLMSQKAATLAIETYPTLIPAQTEFHASASHIAPSKIFPKVKMDAFLLPPTWSARVFEYGSKSTFDSILESKWEDLSSQIGRSTIGEELSQTITCEVEDGNKNCIK